METKVQRARIFIKNLPFSVTDIKLKQHFEKYGAVNEVSLLRKYNGQLLGCGFVQFETPHGALEAVNNTNDSMFLGRQISCKLALYKERRSNQVKKDLQIKEEPEEEDSQIKEEPEEEDSSSIITEERESVGVESDIREIERNNRTTSKRKTSSNLGEECIVENECTTEPIAKNPKLKVYSNDTSQGKTVFVKNVPFTATDDDIHNCFSVYGALEYSLIVKDKYTEHSKGTAFVKFVNKENAEKCLEAGTELQLEGNILDCHVALSKQDLEKTAVDRLRTAENDLPIKKDKQRSKFPRNLHLLNEGAVLAGSTAASSVSAADMQLRLSIAQQRQRRLRAEPNLVVSDQRLIVHNLPPDWTDRHLRAMCKKYDVNVTRNKGKGKRSKGFGAKEVKVMKNRTNDKTSKCYAYIGCDTHEIALSLLRAVNNNPDAFGPPPSPHKRPIVYFSLEDRRVLHKLDKRHQNNNNNKESKEKSNDKNLPKESENRPKRKQKLNDISGSDVATRNSTDNQNNSPFKTRLKHNPRRQLQLHHEQIKQRKHKQRLNKPIKEQKNRQRLSNNVDVIGNDVQSVKSRKSSKGDDNFSKIVAGYKNKLTALSLTATKTKWYES